MVRLEHIDPYLEAVERQDPAHERVFLAARALLELGHHFDDPSGHNKGLSIYTHTTPEIDTIDDGGDDELFVPQTDILVQDGPIDESREPHAILPKNLRFRGAPWEVLFTFEDYHLPEKPSYISYQLSRPVRQYEPQVMGTRTRVRRVGGSSKTEQGRNTIANQWRNTELAVVQYVNDRVRVAA